MGDVMWLRVGKAWVRERSREVVRVVLPRGGVHLHRRRGVERRPSLSLRLTVGGEEV